MNPEKVDKRLTEDIKFLLELWGNAEEGEDEPPVQFQDNLAVVFFAADIKRIANFYFTLGRKYQKRKHKISAVKRYIRRYKNGR